jgi:hypothetical protein
MSDVTRSTFRLAPIGGLGNRLRQILSYRAREGLLEVLWAKSDAVSHGWFLDCFEPLPGVTFTYAGEGHGHDVQGADMVGYAQVAEGAPAGWELGYADLRPTPAITRRVDELLAATDGHLINAIHARRGDHAAHAPKFGHFTTNEELLGWHRGRTRPLYLATDDPATLAYFEPRAGVPVLYNRIPEAVVGYEKRDGTLFDAAVDMFMCAGATEFRGSWMSSFSETIDMIRCGGAPQGGFDMRVHMPSADAEWYRGRPDRVPVQP